MSIVMGGQNIPWGLAVTVFIGTLPLLDAVVSNLAKVDRIEQKMDAGFADVRNELPELRTALAKLAGSLATLGHRPLNTPDNPSMT